MWQLDQLSALLAKINNESVRDYSVEVAKPDEIVAAALGSAGSNGGDGRLPPDFLDSLHGAIRSMRDGAEPDLFRTLRMQCLGCCTVLPDDGYVAIGDEGAATRLLNIVESYRGEPFRFRRLYDALLRGYLGAERHSKWFAAQQVRDGNERLRVFLENNASSVVALQPTPDWALALRRYPEILSPEAGSRFAKDWLTGGGIEFNDMSTKLAISASSWLAAETLRGALAAATGKTDNVFTSHIGALLSAAVEPRFQSLRDEIYAGLLTRYAAMPAPAVHPALRDALVAAWKNPWLERNDSAWRLVPPAARQLVAGWLKLDLIHQFFEVLSEDGQQDKRRFDFWRGYHEAMHDVYFALGSRAFNSRSPDMLKLKHALEGRLLEHTGPGIDASDNAFIMCIGNHVMVEFSKKPNACYVYRKEWLASVLPNGAAPTKPLKGKTAAVAWLPHQPPDRWPSVFAAKLREIERKAISSDPQFGRFGAPLTGTSGGTTHTASLASEWRSLAGAKTYAAPQQSSRPQAYDPVFNWAAGFAKARDILVEDLRPIGGRFWLRTNGSDDEVNRQLKEWGFEYRAGRGWWKEG